MVAVKVSPPTRRDEFEIAIVCSETLAYDAICHLLDEFWDTEGDQFGRARGDPNIYMTGCMGKYNVVVVLLCSSGKATAASTAASLRSSYPCIELLLLIGICNGVPNANEEELLLGDVVIGETVIQYDLGSRHAHTFKEKDALEDRQGRANKNIRNYIASIKTEIGYRRLEENVTVHLEQIQKRVSKPKYRRWREATNYRYPGSINDNLFQSNYCHKHYDSLRSECADCDANSLSVCEESRALDCKKTGCKESHLKPRKRLLEKAQLEENGDLNAAQRPLIFFGRFGSGDTVFNSGDHRDSLAREHNIIAFETEGAGIWDELPCIIVKGVSDYGDGHKTTHWANWQAFAAATAASVARGLVERYPQTDRSHKLPAAALIYQAKEPCLDALFITNPEDDKKRIEETKGGLLLDAYVWVLKNDGFTQWHDDPAIRLLWVKGDPGKGKTMLLCGVINELKKHSSRTIYYFLCQATDSRLNNAAAILRGLLYAMISQQPSLISYIRKEYDISGKSTFEGINSWVVLSRIFTKILEESSLKEPIFVIDALDECVTDLSQFLNIIVESSSSSSQVKWLVSSRNEADILQALAAAKNKSTISLELNAELVSASIKTYIHHKVQILSTKKRYEQHTMDNIEKYLSDNANGTFLWVALVCALLERRSQLDPLPKPGEFPPGLDQLYERMISKVCDVSTSDLGRRVLAIAIVTYRPLTTQEFTSLIHTYDDDESSTRSSEYSWENILGYCGSFLTMREQIIYFIHQSAKDFLIKQATKQLFPNGTEYINRSILKASISAMRNVLKRNIYGLTEPGFSINDLSQHVLSYNPLDPIRYCCVYWIDHFHQSILNKKVYDEDHSKIQELVFSFLRWKYVYWVEALSLLKSIFEGIEGMQKLERLIADSKIPGLKELVWDARRFIQKFGRIIADFPLQIYSSALLFSPARSITRQLFIKDALNWTKTWSYNVADWDPLLRTFGGHSDPVRAVAVSTCGIWLASSSWSDKDIKIWEIKTGRIIQSLECCTDSVKRYSFSPWSSKELASTWDNENIQIWDVTTGELLQQFKVSKSCRVISFLVSKRDLLSCLSFDEKGEMESRMFESIISRGTKENPRDFIRKKEIPIIVASIWNTKTGQMIRSIQLEQTTYVRCLGFNKMVTFSPKDDSVMALLKNANEVVIVDIDTGSVGRTLRWGAVIKSFTFSPSGNQLALFSGEFDGKNFLELSYNIALFDTKSGKKIYLSWDRTHNWGGECDLAFSADGRRLAATNSRNIRILDAASGQCLQTVLTKSRYLVFSPNRNEIYSVFTSVIDVVEVVEAGVHEMQLPLSDYHAPAQRIRDRVSASMSPDGRLLASYFYDSSLAEVTYTDSKAPIHIMNVPRVDKLSLVFSQQDDFSTFVFSPNSKKLAFISATQLSLWDISSKPVRTVLCWRFPVPLLVEHSDMMIFSSDSRLLAASFPFKRVFKLKVWDTDSGECLSNLIDGRKSYVRDVLLSFSSDSKRLAVSWRSNLIDDKCISVAIWNIASNAEIGAANLTSNDLGPSFLHKNWKFDRLSFLGESHLILDMRLDSFDDMKRESMVRFIFQTRTDVGLLKMPNTDLFRFREEKRYNVDSSNSWVTFNGQRLAWIPSEYRPGIFGKRPARLEDRPRVWDAQQNNVVLFPEPSSPFFIQFCCNTCPQETNPSSISVTERASSPIEREYTYVRELNDWQILHFNISSPGEGIIAAASFRDKLKERLFGGF